MIPDSQDHQDGPARLQSPSGVSTQRTSRPTSGETASYHPTSVFRRLLDQSVGVRKNKGVASRKPSPQSDPARRSPKFLTFLGASILFGIASGFLELAVIEIQVHVRQSVGWHSLMVSRHISWMLPVTAPLVITFLTIILVWPTLALFAWRGRSGRRPAPWAVAWAWNWSGTVLGTLVFIGPLFALRVLHPMAAVALAVGLGFRSWRGMFRAMTGWRRLSCWCAGIVLLGLMTCLVPRWNAMGRAPKAAADRPVAGSPNLLWIVVDTLRADRMSVYGYQRRTTPELESWAKQGITFEMARSAAPWTLPSHVTMFTGLWPFEHEARIDRAYRKPSPTLAEHLRSQGYQTGGIVANVRICNAAYGLGRGFDDYLDYPCNREISPRAMMDNSALGSAVMEVGRRMLLPVPAPNPFGLIRTAREITAEGRDWLDGAPGTNPGETNGSRRPFFLFLNLMDVHGPYLPSPAAPREFWAGPIPSKALASPESGWNALRARNVATPEQRGQRERELEDVSRRLGDLYDQCLYGLDAELGRFLGELREKGRLANTWVVITADHGEHFGEHDHFGHGSSLYNEQTHVPLILIPPRGADGNRPDAMAHVRGLRIADPVSLRDLPRTVTDLLISGAHNPFPGRSLAHGLNSSGPVPAGPILSQLEEPKLVGDDFAADQSTRINSVIEENHILIESGGKPPELYALDDAKQERNLADHPDHRSRLARMRETLAALRRGAGS